jgi:hypothetical protein
MSRGVIVLACLDMTCVGFADEKDKDPVKEKLFAARVAYDTETREFRKQVGEWFDKREAAARKAGDKKAIDQRKMDRKAFDADGELPRSAPAAMSQKQDKARKALESAYAEAVKTYIKAKKDDLAAAVEKERDNFRKDTGRPAWSSIFPVGTYAQSYDEGTRSTIELRKDGTFTRVRDGKQYPGTIEFADGKLVLKNDVFIEVWTVVSGEIIVEHWWPAGNYPKGNPTAKGTALRSKD